MAKVLSKAEVEVCFRMGICHKECQRKHTCADNSFERKTPLAGVMSSLTIILIKYVFRSGSGILNIAFSWLQGRFN